MRGSPTKSIDKAKDVVPETIEEEPDVLVFIFGDSTQDWIARSLQFFNKHRSAVSMHPTYGADSHNLLSAGTEQGQRGLSLGLPSGELTDVIRQIEDGISFHAFEALIANSGLTVEEVSGLLGTPARTLARRKRAGRLDSTESDRLIVLATIFEKAVELFNGSTTDSLQWLRQPKKALGGKTPLAYAKTTLGAREVENLIGRMEHGVFS